MKRELKKLATHEVIKVLLEEGLPLFRFKLPGFYYNLQLTGMFFQRHESSVVGAFSSCGLEQFPVFSVS